VAGVVGEAPTAASSLITAAGLAVDAMTQQSSSTVPSGEVISESPAPAHTWRRARRSTPSSRAATPAAGRLPIRLAELGRAAQLPASRAAELNARAIPYRPTVRAAHVISSKGSTTQSLALRF